MNNPRPASPRPATAAALDICCVLAFVIIGRASHTKGETLAGIASTAWPFLAGLGIGWIAASMLARSRKSRSYRARTNAGVSPGGAARTPGARLGALVPGGVCAWLGTVALGMVLRVVSGQGTAVAFIIVALAFLGLFMLGWRLVWTLANRRRHVGAADGGNEV